MYLLDLVNVAAILLQRKTAKLAATVCCEKRQINIKVAAENFFDDFWALCCM